MTWNTGRLNRAVRLGTLALLITGTAGKLAAQSVEMVARVDPGQLSDTGASPSSVVPEEIPAGSPSLSADGRYAVFASSAPNLVPGQKDMNHSNFDLRSDVFLKDFVTGTLALVSHSMGAPTTTGNGGSRKPVISADGRYVAFVSSATDLAPGQAGELDPDVEDVFLFDRITGAIALVADTEESRFSFDNLSISADGRYVTFESYAPDVIPGQEGGFSTSVYLHDRVENRTLLVNHVRSSPVTPGNGSAERPSMSADGRFIVFFSTSSNLVLAPTTYNVVLYDRTSDTLSLVSAGDDPRISADGKYVVFGLNAALHLYDLQTKTITPVTDRLTGISFGEPNNDFSISPDGRFIAYTFGTYLGSDVYDWTLRIYDRLSRTSTEASRPATASPRHVGAPRISADGRFVVFTSLDANVVAGQADTNQSPDVFLYDRTSGRTELVSSLGTSDHTAGNLASSSPEISADGSRVVFSSLATDLVQGVKDLNDSLDFFAYEATSASTSLLTHRAGTLPAVSSPSGSHAHALSADGRFVAFQSSSIHLVPGQNDTNDTLDVFLYDRATRTTILVSRTRVSATTAANGQSVQPAVSADGRYVLFASTATNIAPGANDPEGNHDLFLFDRIAGTTTFVARTGFIFGPEPVEQPDYQISPDGRWVVFASLAADLVPGQREPESQFPTSDVFLWDRLTGTTVLVSRSSLGATLTADSSSAPSALSADGRWVLFSSNATNLVPGQIDFTGTNLFLFDRVRGTTALVSHARDSVKTTAPVEGGGAMSADGRFVVFTSPDGGLDPNASDNEYTGLYLYDRTLQTNQRIAYGSFPWPKISADGRYVTFVASANLLPTASTYGYAQIFVYDRITKALSMATLAGNSSVDGVRADSHDPVISADGRYVAFASPARDLLPGQVSREPLGGINIYLFDRIAGTKALVSRWRGSAVTTAGGSERPAISASGRQVAFTSLADLTERDFNNLPDVHVFSLDPPPSAGPVPLPLCTLLDTRRRADRPVLTSNVQRAVTVRGACGVPAAAKQVRVNVTVFNPSGKGNLRFYPGAVTATPSGILRFERNATRTETFTLPLSANGTLTVLPFVASRGTVHVAVEVTGYSQ